MWLPAQPPKMCIAQLTANPDFCQTYCILTMCRSRCRCPSSKSTLRLPSSALRPPSCHPRPRTPLQVGACWSALCAGTCTAVSSAAGASVWLRSCPATLRNQSLLAGISLPPLFQSHLRQQSTTPTCTTASCPNLPLYNEQNYCPRCASLFQSTMLTCATARRSRRCL